MSVEASVSGGSWSFDQESPRCHLPKGGAYSLGSDPKLFGSVLTLEDLEMIRGFFFVPAEFDIELAKSSERVHRPPSGQLGIYEETLKVGLRFPFHLFIVKLMKDLALNLS